jgi:DNA transformation protein
MAHTDAFVAHCLELLGTLAPARARRMFGGHGLYVGDCFVAIVIRDVLYLKADAVALPAFEAAGCQPFRYTAAGGREAVMAYWSVPDEAMESPGLMLPWARLAMDSALRAAAARRPAALAKRAKPRAKAPRTTPASGPGAAAARRKSAKG